MTETFLAVLAVASIAVIVPAWIRAKRTTPLSATERFKRRLELIAPTASSGRWVVIPESRDDLARAAFRRSLRRRRKLLALLAMTAGLSLAAATTGGGELWQLHLTADVALLSYVLALLQAKRRREETHAKVRSISRRSAARFHPASLSPARAAGSRR